MHRTLILALAVLWPTAGFACNGDAECGAGSTCLKTSGSVAGICVEGIAPSNATDQGALPDPNGTNGKSCTFDTDCGIRSRCLRDYQYSKGVCMVGVDH